MICMHGQSSMYLRKKYSVEVLGRGREMSVVLAKDLPYLMILGRDWTAIYQLLDTIRTQKGLLGEEEVPLDVDGFGIQSLLSSAHFREAQEGEELFRSIIQSELAKQDEQIGCPEQCHAIPRYELRKGLLYRIK